MGLAIHDLPLVREFLPWFHDLEVTRAEVVDPWGYVISAAAAGRSIDLSSAINSTWKPEWLFEVYDRHASLKVTFTPSYVHAGSAVAELRVNGEVRTFGPYAVNGYQGEWQYLAQLARGEAAPIPTDRLIDDLRFAVALAEAASTATAENEEDAA